MTTIKQLADEIGVSKTAIRKKIDDEFRSLYMQEKDGVLYILPEGCELIKKRFRKPVETAGNVSENSKNKFAETNENKSDSVVNQLVSMLQEQLAIKDKQIADKDKQIADKDKKIDDKDKQIADKDKQIADLLLRLSENTMVAYTETLKSLQAAQALHAGTIQTQLIEGEIAETGAQKPAETTENQSENGTKKGFWRKIFHSKNNS